MTNSSAEPAKPRYRYSIGGLLVLLAVVGAFLGFYVNQDNYTSEFILRFPDGHFEKRDFTSKRFIQKVLQRPEAAKLTSVKNGSAANLLKNKLTAVSFMDSYGYRVRLAGNTYRHRNDPPEAAARGQFPEGSFPHRASSADHRA